MIHRWRSRLAILLFPMLLAAPVSAEAELRISDAWIREAPPGTSVLAGYMNIANTGTVEVSVTGVSGPDFSSVEIHRTVVENGIARMLSAERLAIPAGGTLALEPGSYHLMLFNPGRALVAGDVVDLLLHTSDERCIDVSVPVMRKTGDEQP
jgi:copper(I)-binding protein